MREITLRQRFDVLIGEVELTKKLLETVAFEATEDVIEEVEKLTTLLNEPSRDVKNREELTEKRKTLLETVSKEQREVGQYNISRSLRDTQKETYEIQTIIASFRLIRAEMVNNRIFTDDDEIRLDGTPFAGYVEDFRGTPVVWPIHGPSGERMTREFPMARRQDGQVKRAAGLPQNPGVVASLCCSCFRV